MTPWRERVRLAARALGLGRGGLGAAASVVSGVIVVGVVCLVVSPWALNLPALGLLDWDVETAHRYLVTQALVRYREMPYWNPYACGGFPAWGYIEGAPNLVSPWLPLYLALPMAAALRLEVFGMGLLGAAGAYAFAGRFTRSAPARALVVALWAVNGRWALQAAVGHTWHLSYAWMPWCFFFFELARAKPPRLAPLLSLAACLAMLVYSGGIYPLPHTVLALGIYAAALSALERSGRPLAALASAGALGAALSAPKLLPMLATFRKAPRLIESLEWLDLRSLAVILTARDQGVSSRPVVLPPYGWHENGMYISAVGACALLLAVAAVWGRREAALKLAGVALLLLGLGHFHPQAPWSLLHAHVPLFRSQHVPTRFLYPAVLLLSVVAASGLGRALGGRPVREALAAACVLALALDVALVARVPMTQTMRLIAPANVPRDPAFHAEEKGTVRYQAPPLSGSGYLAMRANRGIIDCYGTPAFGPRGARSVSDPRYRGEVYVEPEDAPDAPGVAAAARVAAWSPNRVLAELSGASAGRLVVYNMNFDEGWGSDAGAVISHDDKVAVRLDAARSTVSFVYRPPGLTAGLVLCAFGVLVSGLLLARERRRGDRAGPGRGLKGA